MTPPPAEELLPRLFLGPALRAQSDRRLVGLVREGYETAFDEIMRRYGGQLRRYAAAIVGSRAEDVTQEAFSKALQALRRDGREIELRPWLYRIVRNTALNDIRDRHPAALALADGIVGHGGVAEEVERREEVAELIDRLRSLPEPQRAAIVMRELEGLGHDEIASALGISGGAARQTIHRARTALRNGVGMAVPLPLLKAMLDGSASRSAEIAANGAGAGIALKAAGATVLIAGTFGAGVALHQTADGGHQRRAGQHPGRATAQSQPASTAADTSDGGPAGSVGPHPGRERDRGTDSGTEGGDGHGSGHGRDDGGRHGGGDAPDPSGRHDSSRSGPSPDDGHSGPGGGSSSDDGDSGSGGPGPSGSGSGGTSGSGSSGSGESTESNSGPGTGSSGSDDSAAGEVFGSSSSGSSDSDGGDGFSGQTQLQP